MVVGVAPSSWHYTCRHGFEATLVAELARSDVTASARLPGLVSVAGTGLGLSMDPVYALQVLPRAREVSAPSVSALTRGVLGMIDDEITSCTLDDLQRGTLHVHAMVPPMLKGTQNARGRGRAEAVAAMVREALRKRYACARGVGKGASPSPPTARRALLQLLLLDQSTALASLSLSSRAPPGGVWPNWRNVAGLADVDLDGPMPSSAYRKLLEAFACADAKPAAGATAVDLGASPGGWTAALRRIGVTTTSVDRAPLAPSMMADAGVHFVRGDAFTFAPDRPVDLMVSDVIAYPERVPELLDRWCATHRHGMSLVERQYCQNNGKRSLQGPL